jgi:uncharacterized membrane protein YozB (DUF420 family)
MVRPYYVDVIGGRTVVRPYYVDVFGGRTMMRPYYVFGGRTMVRPYYFFFLVLRVALRLIFVFLSHFFILYRLKQSFSQFNTLWVM